MKALYRRAKAHAAVWAVSEAKADLEKVALLDPSLEHSANALIKEMKENVKTKDSFLKKQLQGKMF